MALQLMSGIRTVGVITALLAPAVAMAAAPSAAVRAACTADAKKLCGSVIRDADARHKCMVEHRAQLSEACKMAIADSHNTPAASDAAPSVTPPTGTTPPAEAPAKP